MGNTMIWEYFEATSPPLSHLFLFLFNGFESFKLLWRFQGYFGHYISLGVFGHFDEVNDILIISNIIKEFMSF